MHMKSVGEDRSRGVVCGKPATIVLVVPGGIYPICDACLDRTEAGRACRRIVEIAKARVRDAVRTGRLRRIEDDN